MSKKAGQKKSRQPDLILGPLPVEVVNRTISTELEPGEVVLSRAAQRHAARRHPEDYPVCLPHLASIILNPLYIGDDHRNPGKIELIGRVAAAASLVLVAVDLERDEDGNYGVSSFYTITQEKAQGRRAKGFLKIPVAAAR